VSGNPPADEFTFDERDRQPFGVRTVGGVDSYGSAAQDDDVVFADRLAI
jgi:hypothetical protein